MDDITKKYGPFEKSDICVKRGQEFPPQMLYYDGVEPDTHNPMCYWCMIKDTQERFGPENVRLPNEN